MEAKSRDLDALQRIQEIDLEIRKLQRQLDELPQKEVIRALREKKTAFEAQSEKIEKIKSSNRVKLNRIEDEDASLFKKETGVQAAIEAAHGDFRNVTARSRELESISRRRQTLEEDRQRIEAEIERLEVMSSQVETTLGALEAQEEESVQSYKDEGGQFKSAIAQRELNRQEVASSVEPALLKRYEKISAQTGGVAIGHLEGSRCGVCHAPIETGRLIALRSQAPLGQCPSCKRLLIVNLEPEAPSAEEPREG